MESSKNPTLISKAWPSDDDDKIYVQWTATNLQSVAEYCLRLRVYAVVDDGQRFTNNRSGTLTIDQQFIYNNLAQYQYDHPVILLDRERQVAEKIAFPAEQDVSYRFDLELITKLGREQIRICRADDIFVGVKPCNYKFLTLSQMDALMRNAANFCQTGQWAKLDCFRRALDPEYWQSVEHLGFMETQPRRAREGHNSPINYVFPGIYFFARPQRESWSPFGGILKEFPPTFLLGPNPGQELAFYFADIKCYSSSGKNHYITIAICRKGSKVDQYCTQHLPSLDPLDNPFLRIVRDDSRLFDDGSSWYVEVPVMGPHIWIEILYMHRLYSKNWHELNTIKIDTGSPIKTQIALDCKICCWTTPQGTPVKQNGRCVSMDIVELEPHEASSFLLPSK